MGQELHNASHECISHLYPFPGGSELQDTRPTTCIYIYLYIHTYHHTYKPAAITVVPCFSAHFIFAPRMYPPSSGSATFPGITEC